MEWCICEQVRGGRYSGFCVEVLWSVVDMTGAIT